MIGLGSDKDGKVVMGIMALIGNGKIASNPPNPDDLVVVGECSVSLHKRICIHLFNAFSYYSSFIQGGFFDCSALKMTKYKEK